MGEEMNTFTFTDDEVKVIKVALDQYKNNLATFHNMLTSSGVSESIMKERNSAINGAINKLERKPIKYSGGGMVPPSFDHRGNIKFNPKEK